MKSESPLISIIITIYNTEEYLTACLQSVLHQTYENLDIILIDAGSTDKSSRICDLYAEVDSRIRVFHLPDKGITHARNTGLREAKGEYIGFLDSDDWIDLETIHSLYDIMQQYNADISMSPYYIEKEGKNKWSFSLGEVKQYNRKKALCELYENRIVRNYLNDKLFKRHLFENIIFQETGMYDDSDVLCFVLFKTGRLVIHPEPFYHYRTYSKKSIPEKGIEMEYKNICQLDHHYKFLEDNGLNINKYPKCITAGLKLMNRLKADRLNYNNEDIIYDVYQRLRFYSQMPIRKVGVSNFMLLHFFLNRYKRIIPTKRKK